MSGLRWILGIDEAGYGPNLGPLAMGLTAWRIDATNGEESELYPLLERAITPLPDGERLAIGDSKGLYQSGKGGGRGLAILERGLLATLMASDTTGKWADHPRPCGEIGRQNGLFPPPKGGGREVKSWDELLELLQADPDRRREELPWQARFNAPLPQHASPASIQAGGELLRRVGEQQGVIPQMVRARLVFPGEFNGAIRQHGSKGAALSHATLSLLRGGIDELTRNSTQQGEFPCFRIVCDKHGGRNKYGPLLAHHFPGEEIAILGESRGESRYRVGRGEGEIEIRFCSKGERFAETALASMTAKYLREGAMQAFNHFWGEQVPGLRPTAGYPVDAKRFRQEIAAAQARLGIADDLLWRHR